MKRVRDIKLNERVDAAREVLDSDDRGGFNFASCDYRLCFLDEIRAYKVGHARVCVAVSHFG